MKKIPLAVLVGTTALAGSLVAARADDTNSIAAPAADPAMAPANSADPDAWQFGVTVPLWAPQIDGNVTLAGHRKDLNVNFSELKDHLDASFSLAANAQKGKFGIFGNVGYMKFSGGFSDALGGQTDAGLKFLVANSGVSYQLVKTECEHPFILTGTAGVRFWYVSTSLSHRNNLGTRDWHGYENYNLFDPVIGLRASQYLTRKLHLDLSGDFGGFNISHDTDITWSAAGMLTYDFTKWFSLSAGYQALAIDESTGDGGNKHGLNLIFSGVAAAATFKF